MDKATEIGRLAHGGRRITVYTTRYSVNRALAVFAECDSGEPFAVISENHIGADLGDGEFVAQTRNLMDGLTDALLRSSIIEDTGRCHTFGPFETAEPIWRINGGGK